MSNEGQEDSGEGRPAFTDSKGREWHPVITIGAVRRWERRAKVAFHKAVFDENDNVLLQVDNIISLAWEAIRDEVEDVNKGRPANERIDFADFEGSFDCGITISDTARALRLATFAYFPRPTPENAGASGGGKRRPTDGGT